LVFIVHIDVFNFVYEFSKILNISGLAKDLTRLFCHLRKNDYFCRAKKNAD